MSLDIDEYVKSTKCAQEGCNRRGNCYCFRMRRGEGLYEGCKKSFCEDHWVPHKEELHEAAKCYQCSAALTTGGTALKASQTFELCSMACRAAFLIRECSFCREVTTCSHFCQEHQAYYCSKFECCLDHASNHPDSGVYKFSLRDPELAISGEQA